MIIVKVINQKVVQIAFANQSNGMISTVLATKNSHKQVVNFARHLTQSTSQNQKVTNANNQQLIPIARNISFRKCNSKVSFSISASSPTSSISTEFEPSITTDIANERLQSPLEALKRKAKDVVEKRELLARNEYYGQTFDKTLTTTASGQRLVVLMSWLEAKEKHIEKYRQFYLDRGFDVLNVKTSPLDLLLPNVGARKISEDFVRFMVEKQYSNVLLHGFSVGGYMFGRLLLEIDRLQPTKRNNLLNSIRGLVFDSLVPFEGTCVGVANSITSNQIAAKVIENILKFYLYVGKNIATKHYLEASEKVWGGPLKVPSLFVVSKDDPIADFRIIERLTNDWTRYGIDVRKMVVDSSPHVQIFTKHHDAYKKTVENFLRDIKMF